LFFIGYELYFISKCLHKFVLEFLHSVVGSSKHSNIDYSNYFLDFNFKQKNLDESFIANDVSSNSSSYNSDLKDIPFHTPLDISDRLFSLDFPSSSNKSSSSLSFDAFHMFSLLHQLSMFLIIEPSLFLVERIHQKYCPDISLLNNTLY
jgi:hypothetical protein